MEKISGKRICLITPGHISSNPRLVKEAKSLSEIGYQVHIVFTQNINFLIKHDEKILLNNPSWTYDVLNNCNPSNTKALINKLKGIFINIFKVLFLRYRCIFFVKHILNRNYNWQLNKAIEIKADLYLAHNLGALSVAKLAAKKNNSKYAFDAEDFHRNEISDDPNSITYQVNSFTEDKLINNVSYLSCASPLIAEKYKDLYPKISNIIIINNVFSVKFIQKKTQNNYPKLKLFWFSQTIGKGRGLEDVIIAIRELNNPNISLHLLGNTSSELEEYFSLYCADLISNNQIFIYKTIPENELFKFANQFDIGLALEKPFPLNRDICLTNKIFTYLNSGLAIIATNTMSQSKLLEEIHDVGEIYENGNINELKEIINYYNNTPNILFETKKKSLEVANRIYNWELESKIFLKEIKKIFK